VSRQIRLTENCAAGAGFRREYEHETFRENLGVA